MQAEESLLIVARPDRWLEALCVLLAARPHLRIIGQADGAAAALQIMRDQSPSLVLLDASLAEPEMKLVLDQVKAQQPAPRCIVLAANPRQQQLARAAGADTTLLKTTSSTASLLAALA